MHLKAIAQVEAGMKYDTKHDKGKKDDMSDMKH